MSTSYHSQDCFRVSRLITLPSSLHEKHSDGAKNVHMGEPEVVHCVVKCEPY